MNEDTLLSVLKQHLSDISDVPQKDIHLGTLLEEELYLNDESFEFFLIDLQDAVTLPELSGIMIRDLSNVESLIESITDLVFP